MCRFILWINLSNEKKTCFFFVISEFWFTIKCHLNNVQTFPFGRVVPGHNGFVGSKSGMLSICGVSDWPLHGRCKRCGLTSTHWPINGLKRQCWCSSMNQKLITKKIIDSISTFQKKNTKKIRVNCGKYFRSVQSKNIPWKLSFTGWNERWHFRWKFDWI